MRELKFRCKRESNGKWQVFRFGALVDGSAYDDFIQDCKPETIGQYTGLKDKNGKEIYELDWLEFDTQAIHASIIKWGDIAGGWEMHGRTRGKEEKQYFRNFNRFHARKGTVIGNQFEGAVPLRKRKETP